MAAKDSTLKLELDVTAQNLTAIKKELEKLINGNTVIDLKASGNAASAIDALITKLEKAKILSSDVTKNLSMVPQALTTTATGTPRKRGMKEEDLTPFVQFLNEVLQGVQSGKRGGVKKLEPVLNPEYFKPLSDGTVNLNSTMKELKKSVDDLVKAQKKVADSTASTTPSKQPATPKKTAEQIRKEKELKSAAEYEGSVAEAERIKTYSSQRVRGAMSSKAGVDISEVDTVAKLKPALDKADAAIEEAYKRRLQLAKQLHDARLALLQDENNQEARMILAKAPALTKSINNTESVLLANANARAGRDLKEPKSASHEMVNSQVWHMAKGMMLAQAVIQTTQAVGGLIKSIFEYNKELEISALGVKAILTSMARVKDIQGEWVFGQAKYNAMAKISLEAQKELQNIAFQTAATYTELVDVFQSMLAPAMAAKMTFKQVLDLTGLITNSVKAIGLPFNQIRSEARDLLQGNITAAHSSLAMALNIDNQMIKQWRQRGTLYEELRNRLQGFTMASKEFETTWEGAVTNLKDFVQRSFGEAGKPFYEQVKKDLMKFTQDIAVIKKDTDGKVIDIQMKSEFKNEIKDIIALFKAMYEIAMTLGKVLVWVVEIMGRISSVPGFKYMMIATIGYFALMSNMAKAWATSLATVVFQLNAATTAMARLNATQIAAAETRAAGLVATATTFLGVYGKIAGLVITIGMAIAGLTGLFGESKTDEEKKLEDAEKYYDTIKKTQELEEKKKETQKNIQQAKEKAADTLKTPEEIGAFAQSAYQKEVGLHPGTNALQIKESADALMAPLKAEEQALEQSFFKKLISEKEYLDKKRVLDSKLVSMESELNQNLEDLRGQSNKFAGTTGINVASILNSGITSKKDITDIMKYGVKGTNYDVNADNEVVIKAKVDVSLLGQPQDITETEAYKQKFVAAQEEIKTAEEEKLQAIKTAQEKLNAIYAVGGMSLEDYTRGNIALRQGELHAELDAAKEELKLIEERTEAKRKYYEETYEYRKKDMIAQKEESLAAIEAANKERQANVDKFQKGDKYDRAKMSKELLMSNPVAGNFLDSYVRNMEGYKTAGMYKETFYKTKMSELMLGDTKLPQDKLQELGARLGVKGEIKSINDLTSKQLQTQIDATKKSGEDIVKAINALRTGPMQAWETTEEGKANLKERGKAERAVTKAEGAIEQYNYKSAGDVLNATIQNIQSDLDDKLSQLANSAKGAVASGSKAGKDTWEQDLIKAQNSAAISATNRMIAETKKWRASQIAEAKAAGDKDWEAWVVTTAKSQAGQLERQRKQLIRGKQVSSKEANVAKEEKGLTSSRGISGQEEAYYKAAKHIELEYNYKEKSIGLEEQLIAFKYRYARINEAQRDMALKELAIRRERLKVEKDLEILTIKIATTNTQISMEAINQSFLTGQLKISLAKDELAIAQDNLDMAVKINKSSQETIDKLKAELELKRLSYAQSLKLTEQELARQDAVIKTVELTAQLNAEIGTVPSASEEIAKANAELQKAIINYASLTKDTPKEIREQFFKNIELMEQRLTTARFGTKAIIESATRKGALASATLEANASAGQKVDLNEVGRREGATFTQSLARLNELLGKQRSYEGLATTYSSKIGNQSPSAYASNFLATTPLPIAPPLPMAETVKWQDVVKRMGLNERDSSEKTINTAKTIAERETQARLAVAQQEYDAKKKLYDQDLQLRKDMEVLSAPQDPTLIKKAEEEVRQTYLNGVKAVADAKATNLGVDKKALEDQDRFSEARHATLVARQQQIVDMAKNDLQVKTVELDTLNKLTGKNKPDPAVIKAKEYEVALAEEKVKYAEYGIEAYNKEKDAIIANSKLRQGIKDALFQTRDYHEDYLQAEAEAQKAAYDAEKRVNDLRAIGNENEARRLELLRDQTRLLADQAKIRTNVGGAFLLGAQSRTKNSNDWTMQAEQLGGDVTNNLVDVGNNIAKDFLWTNPDINRQIKENERSMTDLNQKYREGKIGLNEYQKAQWDLEQEHRKLTDSIKTVGDAFTEFAKQVAASLAKIASEQIVGGLVSGIGKGVNWLTSPGSTLTAPNNYAGNTAGTAYVAAPGRMRVGSNQQELASNLTATSGMQRSLSKIASAVDDTKKTSPQGTGEIKSIVNVHNNGAPVQAESTSYMPDPRTMVTDIVLSDILGGGRISQAIGRR